MLNGQDQSQLFRCPRCGGAMSKPAGSTMYWHADNNHPRCSITNIAFVQADKKSSLTEEKQQPPTQKL